MSRKADTIHTSDEETVPDNSGDEAGKSKVIGGEGGKDANGQKEVAPELLKTKRPRHNKPFTEDLLMGVTGLPRVYNEFPIASSKYQHTRGSEAAYLKRLITLYKEWSFQLHPGLSFEDVAMKCEILGSKTKVRMYMQQMRENERDRYIDEVLMPLIRAREEQDMELLKSVAHKPKKSRQKERVSTTDFSQVSGDDIPTQAEQFSHGDIPILQSSIVDGSNRNSNAKPNDEPFGNDDNMPFDDTLQSPSQFQENSENDLTFSSAGQQDDEENSGFRGKDIEDKDFSSSIVEEEEICDEITQQQ